METKILLRDIPSGKFHSAICTTYSINLYYLEQQVLPLLSTKGIHYVSLLVDGNMLTGQLGTYTFMSESKKRHYALHGIDSTGAFHPKIIFLAGDKTLLLLIGSGNMTSCGHGLNLESWSAFYLEDASDARFGLLLDCWDFLLHQMNSLSCSAKMSMQAIADNCTLLLNHHKIPRANFYPSGLHRQMMCFLGSHPDNSLFDQLCARIGDQKIKKIHLFSPFYDPNGAFILALQERFDALEINVILQENFGTPPRFIQPFASLNFYLWKDNRSREFKQYFFHAKHLIFEGEQHSFLFSGSANASIAAFGTLGSREKNTEAGILYQSSEMDFLKELDISFKKSIAITQVSPGEGLDNKLSDCCNVIFITGIEKHSDHLLLYLRSARGLSCCELQLYDAKGNMVCAQFIEVNPGDAILKMENQISNLLYAQVCSDGVRVSNKQFIINFAAFEASNPSPKNRSLNQVRKLIESGGFSSQKIIDYLNTLHLQKSNEIIEVAGKSELGGEEQGHYPENTELIHLSYSQIQLRMEELNKLGKIKGHSAYNTVRLWDSIFLYLKEAREKREDVLIDEEESEDINQSSGRVAALKEETKKRINKSIFNQLKSKVEKFFDEYISVLQNNIASRTIAKPNLIDLSMYLIILEMLFHLSTHKEHLENDEKSCLLLDLSFSDKYHSWSEFLTSTVGLFTLWCAKSDGFDFGVETEYRKKMLIYIDMAYKTTLAGLSVLTLVNTSYDRSKIERWKLLNLMNAQSCFKISLDDRNNMDDILLFIPEELSDFMGRENLLKAIEDCLPANFNVNKDERYFQHPEDGWTYIHKFIPNAANAKFYRLVHPGYDWHQDFMDYSEARLFSPESWKWLKPTSMS